MHAWPPPLPCLLAMLCLFVQDLAGLESRISLKNPGEWKDLEQAKKMEIEEVEGLSVNVQNTVKSTPEGSALSLLHQCVAASL